jgi:DNA invertase Pin-like site-specific DNA recombinase
MHEVLWLLFSALQGQDVALLFVTTHGRVLLRVLDQAVDTATAAGKAFFGMLAVFAQFETDVRRERQAEGIARIMNDPKLRLSKYKGAKPRIDSARVQTLKRGGLGPTDIATRLGISRMSVYRLQKENWHAPS